MQTGWNFYILRGVSKDDKKTFWKVGTSKGPFRMKGRTTYGSAVDPSIRNKVSKSTNRVYRKPWGNGKWRLKVSYDAPKIGLQARVSEIGWIPVVKNIAVYWKEIDQLIAAIADDLGSLVFDRGTPSRAGNSGCIELIDGDADLYELVQRIAKGPTAIGVRAMSDEQWGQIEGLAARLKLYESKFRSIDQS